MKRGISLLLTLLLPSPALSQADVAQRFRERVTTLASPAMEGRSPGSLGLEKARDFVVEQFKQAGLQPAFNGSYTQSFPISIGVMAREQTLSLGEDAGAPERDFNALGFSASKPFDADAVFVGYGIVDEGHHYDSYRPPGAGAGGDAAIKGKVVIAFRFEPQDPVGRSKWTQKDDSWSRASHLTNKAQWAAEHGAVALLLVTPPSQQQKDPALRTPRQTGGSAVADIPALQITPELFGRILHRAGRHPVNAQVSFQQQADQGDGVIVPLDGVRLRGSVKLERSEATVANIGGILPGRGALRDELIVIGAHYDHLGFGDIGSLAGTTQMHPGADDNASGTAALISIAERLTQDNSTADRRTILLVAFTAEERGLIGSSHLVAHFEDTGRKITEVAAMLNLDMVGRMQDQKLYVLGLGSGHGWRELIDAAVKTAGLKIVTQENAHGASDHSSFYRGNVPAVHFFTGIHKDYHRPSDTADKINSQGGAQVIEVVADVARRLAERRERITFDTEGAREASMMQGGPFNGATLGIMPDYGTLDGAKGCGLMGVTPGSPAEGAGLATGDLITAWNGKKIGNVQDLTAALGKANPGDKVKLQIKREGKDPFEVEVTLGRR